MKKRNSITLKYKLLFFKAWLFLTLLISNNLLLAQDTIVISKQKLPLSIGNKVGILYDNERIYDSSNIIFQKDFKVYKKSIPVLSLPENNIWIKFSVKNNSNS